MTGNFSSHYMSRNRIKPWTEPSFTIQASGRHAPCHPDSGSMQKIAKDVCKFTNPKKVRRLSFENVPEFRPSLMILYLIIQI